MASLLPWKPAQQGWSHRFTGLYDAAVISPADIGSGLGAQGAFECVTVCVFERSVSEMKTYAEHLMIHPEEKLFCGAHVRWHCSHLQDH